MKKVVLIIVSAEGGRIPAFEQASKRAELVRRRGELPMALFLAWDVSADRPESIAEARLLERELIVRRAPDAVEFTDPDAEDVRELRDLAQQYHLWREPAALATAAAA